MVLRLALLFAVFGIALCFYLWFRDVRRVMSERKSMVESAAIQVTVYREKALKIRGEPETAAVLERSERIYRQAVDRYNQALQKPGNYLPAHLMGFHSISCS